MFVMEHKQNFLFIVLKYNLRTLPDVIETQQKVLIRTLSMTTPVQDSDRKFVVYFYQRRLVFAMDRCTLIKK